MQGMSPGAGFHTHPWVRGVHCHTREGKGLVPSKCERNRRGISHRHFRKVPSHLSTGKSF